MEPLFNEQRENFSVDASTSEDRLKLFITVKRNGNHPSRINRNTIIETLQAHIDANNVIVGVIDDIVKILQEGEAQVCDRKILSGRPAIAGSPGRVEFLVKSYAPGTTVSIDRQGVTTRSDTTLFQNVEQDQVVARVYPPGTGIDGIDVFGAKIEARKGEAATVRISSRLAITSAEDPGAKYQEIVALTNGYLEEQNGSIDIRSTLRIQDDLDFRYGSIDFIGRVELGGDVMPGFHVRARNGIKIKGSVRGGSLIATQGDIYVSDYAFGGSRSRILAGGTLTAWVVQEIDTEIIGNIYIRKESQNSKLRTSGALIMPNGVLLGGEAFVVRGVEARILGSEAGTRTAIHLANTMEASLEYGKLNVDIERYNHELELVQLKLGPHADACVEGALPPAVLNDPRLLALATRLRTVSEKRSLCAARLNQLMNNAKLSDVLRVNFLEVMHEGVEVRCGAEKFINSQRQQGPGTLEFVISAKKFVMRNYEPLEY